MVTSTSDDDVLTLCKQQPRLYLSYDLQEFVQLKNFATIPCTPSIDQTNIHQVFSPARLRPTVSKMKLLILLLATLFFESLAQDFVQRPELSRRECLSQGGMIVGDITRSGAIHRASYRCQSNGQAPFATVVPSRGEALVQEGEVCCGVGDSKTDGSEFIAGVQGHSAGFVTKGFGTAALLAVAALALGFL